MRGELIQWNSCSGICGEVVLCDHLALYKTYLFAQKLSEGVVVLPAAGLSEVDLSLACK